MNKDLCKKLKQLGFPQIYKIYNGGLCDLAYCDEDQDEEIHLIHVDNDEGCVIGNNYGHRINMLEDLSNYVKIPTLSEIIEVCGNEFDSLEKRDDTFLAYGSSKDSAGLKINPFFAIGKTPEEALAYLWININS